MLEEGICGVSDFLSRWSCTWTATDECGNTSTYTLFVEIVDTEAPQWTYFPDDVTQSCEEILVFDTPQAADACSSVDLTFEEDIVSGGCPNNYEILRYWTAVDGCGNSTTQTQRIIIVDENSPTLYPHASWLQPYENGDDVLVECSRYGELYNLIGAVLASDYCGGEVSIDYGYEEEDYVDCLEYGYSQSMIGTWTARDACGNTASFSLRFLLVDETAPEILGVPEDICVSSLPPVPNVQAVDECEFATISFEQTEPQICGNSSFIERIWTAEDPCGNVSVATQRITLLDTEGPVLELNYPGHGVVSEEDIVIISADCTNNPTGIPDFTPYVLVTDECSTYTLEIIHELLDEGDCDTDDYLWRYSIRLLAVDACGNERSLRFVAVLIDEIGPEFALDQQLVSYSCGEAITVPEVTDACTEVISLTFEDISDPIISCASNPQAFERSWTAVDGCGNETILIQEVTIIDAEGPLLIGVPADACDDTSPPPFVTAVDQCSDSDVIVSLVETTEDTPCGEVLIRTWTAVDNCGNETSAEQRIVFNDTSTPVLSFNHPLLVGLLDGETLQLPISFELGSPSHPIDFGDNAVVVYDDCAGELVAELTIDRLDEGDCLNDGYLSRDRYTWVAVDPCGNTSKITVIVEYVDDLAPEVVNWPEDHTVYCDEELPPLPELIIQDDSGVNEISIEETTVETEFGALTERTWIIADYCGNTTEVEQNIYWYENRLECTFTDFNIVTCNSSGNLLSAVVNGGQGPYSYEWEMIDCDGFITGGQGTSTVEYTVGYTTQNFLLTVTDANGCQTTCTTSVVCSKDRDGDATQGFVIVDTDRYSMQVYPNPTRETLTVEYHPINTDAGISQVLVSNLYGQVMISRKGLPSGTYNLDIDVSALPAATYSLHLRLTTGEVLTTKVVKLD